METKRTYDDGCAAAHALDLVGERWALLVVRELLLGPKRFTDLRQALPGISPNVLSQRLEELERVAIVIRRRLPPPGAAQVYELTEWGQELEPVICGLGRWAARSPAKPEGCPMSVNSMVLSFRTMFDRMRAGDFRAIVGLVLRGQPCRAAIGRGRLEIALGEAPDADVVITAQDPTALAAVVYGGRPLEEAMRSGDLVVSGDVDAAKHFVTLFPLPERAPAVV